MKNGIILLISGIVVGFLLHAFIFPDFLSNGIIFIPKLTPEQTAGTPQNALQASEPIIKTISYDGNRFSRTNVTVERSRYFAISNESQTELMELDSDLATLRTPRPYAYKEVIKARMEKAGTFIVSTKKDPDVRIIITVK